MQDVLTLWLRGRGVREESCQEGLRLRRRENGEVLWSVIEYISCNLGFCHALYSISLQPTHIPIYRTRGAVSHKTPFYLLALFWG